MLEETTKKYAILDHEFVVNPEDYTTLEDGLETGLYIFSDIHGTGLCAAFAENLSDAYDAVADAGKLDAYEYDKGSDDEDHVFAFGNKCILYEISDIHVRITSLSNVCFAFEVRNT